MINFVWSVVAGVGSLIAYRLGHEWASGFMACAAWIALLIACRKSEGAKERKPR